MILIIGGAGQGKLDYVLRRTGLGPEMVARDPEGARTLPILYGLEQWPQLDEQARLAADPDIILIQGDYADAGEYFLETLRGYVKSYAAPAVSVIPVIRLSTLSDNESCRLGGGLIAVNHVFNQDEIYE